MFDQIVDRVFEGAGLEVALVVDHANGVLVVVVVLEAGHGRRVLAACDESMLPEQNWRFRDFFYSLNVSRNRRICSERSE